jgi:hypothetical protein
VEKKLHSGQDHLHSEANPFHSLLKKQHEPKPSNTLVQAASDKAKGRPFEGIVLGHLVGLTDEGDFLVQFPGNPDGEQPLRALAATEISKQRVGSPVALSFLEGDIHQPLILGFIRSNANEAEAPGKQTIEVQQDDKRLVITAENELVLKCGESTITLTKAGKIIIRGKYLLSRAEGVNRIKGGAVQIN